MEKTFFDCVTDGGKNTVFGLPFTEELIGRTATLAGGEGIRFGKELVVKCDDDLFLVDAGGKILLVEELPDESLKALDAEKETESSSALPVALEGWETDLCLASGCVLTARFRDGALTLSPSPEPDIANAFSSGGALAAPKTKEASAAPVGILPLRAVQTGEKRFLLRFPETGETVFLDARRFLLYAILRGRIVSGFVEIPPKE